MIQEGSSETITLRDGASVLIRPVSSKDADSLLEFYRAVPDEDRRFLKDDVTKKDWAERFLAHVTAGEAVSLVAELEGVIIGEATLYRTLHGWSTHVGEIRVTVSRWHRRKGLGTALARTLVKQATRLGVEKLVVQVVENQIAARRTFEKLGFKQEAILRGHVRDISGTRRDLLVFANDVSHIWHAMEAMLADYSPGAD